MKIFHYEMLNLEDDDGEWDLCDGDVTKISKNF